eukprot:1161078-Pelagomonas_calceolata.AAC.14
MLDEHLRTTIRSSISGPPSAGASQDHHLQQLGRSPCSSSRSSDAEMQAEIVRHDPQTQGCTRRPASNPAKVTITAHEAHSSTATNLAEAESRLTTHAL